MLTRRVLWHFLVVILPIVHVKPCDDVQTRFFWFLRGRQGVDPLEILL